MKFPFVVKHNGVEYEPGQEVPIGKEPVKENSLNDMSVAEIRKELMEVYGVEKFPSNKKSDLIALLEEKKAEAESNEDEGEDEEDETNSSDNDSDITSSDLDEDEEDTDNEEDGEEDDLLNTIINED